MDTRSSAYAQRLLRTQSGTWKRILPNPYRWWLRRQDLGFVLDVGCGAGRSLEYLNGHGVGIDHNAEFVAHCRSVGLEAFTPEEFAASCYNIPGRFDTMIMMHVLEHLGPGQADTLFSTYLPLVREGGCVVLVTPQERGFASDPSHTEFVHGDDLVDLCRRHNLSVDQWESFPFPAWAGRAWVYNEFNVVATLG